MAKLRVFRTAIGFHDAYVAAPSRAAALRAWGSDKDLFARGAAEEVTDAALMKAPLAEPGAVIRVLRGSAEEQLAQGGKARGARPVKAAPKPSRERLDAAEATLAEASARYDAEDAALAKEAGRIARERAAVAKRRETEVGRLEKARGRAEADYDRALEKWRD